MRRWHEPHGEAVELLQAADPLRHRQPARATSARRRSTSPACSAAPGFACELLGRTPERPNLVARLDGAEPGPVLCLLSHVDTVLATPSEWTHDPWSGDLDDGFVWGRGALDMKSQTAAEVVAACSLAREGWRPARGALLVVVLVDEETGGAEGAQLADRDPPRQGPLRLPAQRGRRRHRRRTTAGASTALGCAEKGVFRFVVHTDGVAAHGVDAAARRQRAAEARRRSSSASPRASRRYRLTDEPRAFLEAIGALDAASDAAAALERVRARRAAAGGAGRADARRLARADARVRLRQDQRDPVARAPRGRLPRAARARRGRRRRTAIDEVARRRASYRIEWLEQVDGQPLADRLAARRRDPRLGRRAGRRRRSASPTMLAGLHRLAHVPRRVPGVRRLRLLPAPRAHAASRPIR